MKLLNNMTFGQLFRLKRKRTRKPRSMHLVNEKTHFNIKEAYKTCRTNIIFSLPKEKSSVIVVTSSWPMEGKTTNAANLAATFSQVGGKVLLIDADLRKPRLAKIFNLNTKNGLTNCLRKFCSIEEGIHETQYPDLFVMPSGHIPPNPAELLGSPEMGELLSELKERFSYIIIDTPPVNLLADALMLTSQASGTVIVARQGVTDHKSMSEALEKMEFSNSKVLGFILNDASEDIGGYKYQGGGKYNYYKRQYYNSYYQYKDS